MRLAILVLAVGSVAWGQNGKIGCTGAAKDGVCVEDYAKWVTDAVKQQPCTGGGKGHTNPPDCIPAEKYFKGKIPEPAPLKCGKYQHVQTWKADCDVFQAQGCLKVDTPYCADDMHSVTEREWQEIMARLKKLEKATEPCRGPECYQTPATWDIKNCGIKGDGTDCVKY